MKDGIVSFRLPAPFDAKLVTATSSAKTTVVGIRSENHLARKLVVDYLEGRLVYLDQTAKTDNPMISHAARS